MHSFETEKQAKRDDFGRVKFGLGMLLDSTQLVIYHTKEPDDYFFGSHKAVSPFSLVSII
jgi:hypothetical protein